MEIFVQKVLSNGLAMGNCKVYYNEIDIDSTKSDIEEIALLRIAIDRSYLEIKDLINKEPDLVDYLTAQSLMIKDPYLFKKACDYIENGNSARKAFKKAMDDFKKNLKISSSSYLKERVLDLDDVSEIVISNMKEKSFSNEEHPYILVVDELRPSQLLKTHNNLIGIVARKGGYTTHSSIMARSFDIPYVVCDIECSENDTIIIDTRLKKVILDPTPAIKEAYSEAILNYQSFMKKAIPHDGYQFLANVGSNRELKRVNDYEFDGVGLYRSELIFMNQDRPYSFNEQYFIYKDAMDIIGNKKMIMRTFDIGDDKQISYLKASKKGIVNYKNNKEIFENQVGAMMKANTNDNLWLMFPMIENVEDFNYLKNWVLRIRKENNYLMPKIGMMLETKEALNNIKDFKDVDFISIGTNDLTRELYNIKREDNMFLNDEQFKDLLNKIKIVVDFCDKNNICLSICGELASIKECAIKFFEIGVKNLSISPSLIQILNTSFNEFKTNIKK
jgi:phosphoenolpyruvate-protein kinase (PTS system EI component)